MNYTNSVVEVAAFFVCLTQNKTHSQVHSLLGGAGVAGYRQKKRQECNPHPRI